MLSSIHAFSVELRLASESVLGKVKYVTVKQSLPFRYNVITLYIWMVTQRSLTTQGCGVSQSRLV